MSRSRAPVAGLDIVTLARGYPPVLGAMLLVDGVLTVILGGDATVSLGEVVAYLLLPPLAMFLLTQVTGGRRPSAVTLGIGVAGAAVLFAALFLLGGVHLVTLPGWVLALVGLALLGVAVVLMRKAAPDREEPAVPPLLNQNERASFSRSDDDPVFGGDPASGGGSAADEYGSGGSRDFGAGPAHAARVEYGEFGAHHGSSAADYGSGYDGPAESEWPPPRHDDEPYPAVRAADDTVAGLPRVPSEPAPGPPEPEWPPRRADGDARPTWTDRADGDARPTWTDRADAQPDWSAGNRAGAGSAWSDGPADREWPPSSSARDRPSRQDPEPGPRSWFETDGAQPFEAQPFEAQPFEARPVEAQPFEAQPFEVQPTEDAQPAEPTWRAGPPDSQWPPAERTYPSGGRRSRHPDQ